MKDEVLIAQLQGKIAELEKIIQLQDEKINKLTLGLESGKRREEKSWERIAALKRQIAELQNSTEKRSVGRPGIAMDKKELVILLYRQKLSIRKIADRVGISTGSVCNILNENREKLNMIVRMKYMYRDQCCTEIEADFTDKKIRIRNTTDDVFRRAFGNNLTPDWEQFEQFLEERCFPRSRHGMKLILRDMGLQSYDPWQIVHITQGRMAGDQHWISFEE